MKTYGVGKDISWKHWQYYLVQLVNQGYCQIAFHQHNTLHLNEFSKKILFEGEKIFLTKPVEIVEKTEIPTIKKKNIIENSLFERLRALRNRIAKEENIAAYVVFSDATLREIERQRPLSDEEFLGISGVGRRKLEVYGGEFVAEIKNFLSEKKRKTKDTTGITYKLYKEGFTVAEIAEQRDLKSTTIFSHLSKLYLEGKNIDLRQYVTAEEMFKLANAKKVLQNEKALKPYYEFLNEKLSYEKIRIGLTILEKK
ncbi:helix-turn-helix domain-containing protein [Tenacibaculum sp. SG-28]|uniref:helix-turn-helix domain-containing protein n=1 Tax=Tenacibaculum sp. SG-28 TaxID=754426 RepID=UPI0035177871